MFGKFLSVAKDRNKMLEELDSWRYVIVNKNESDKILAVYQTALKNDKANSKCLLNFSPYQTIAIKF